MAFDDALAFVRVVSTTLSASAKQILVSLAGFKDGDSDDPADNEGSTAEPLFGAIGVFSRPRDADADGAAELVAARTEDGLQPIAGRDMRIVKARGNVAKGSISLAGYGGGFVAIEDTPEATSSIVILYAPYPGTPAPKAHAIALDTTAGNESVVIAHADGMAITMSDGKLVLRSKSGKAIVILDDDTITLSGKSIVIQGNVALGANPATAIPMAPGAGFAGSTSVAVSP